MLFGGSANGVSQFMVLTTFVTGFWYGAFLVRTGRNTPGDVMAVFWACLIASDNLQLIFPRLNKFNRGKEAMVSLLNLINTPLPPSAPLPPPPEIQNDSTLKEHRLISLRPSSVQGESTHLLEKIVPSFHAGVRSTSEMSHLLNPSRQQPALKNVDMFFPAGEVTYIVGSSGSGKSTVAALLTRLYTPQYGIIELDDQSLHHLDLAWTRSNIFHVSQNPILFSGTIAYNVAMGLAGSPFRTPSDCSKAEVIAACKAGVLHDFIKDLDKGYDTLIGPGGLGLSGGQKQRLALARARVRDPAILILGNSSTYCISAITTNTLSPRRSNGRLGFGHEGFGVVFFLEVEEE